MGIQCIVEEILPHAIESSPAWVAGTAGLRRALCDGRCVQLFAGVADGRIPIVLEAGLPAHRPRIRRELAHLSWYALNARRFGD